MLAHLNKTAMLRRGQAQGSRDANVGEMYKNGLSLRSLSFSHQSDAFHCFH